MIEKKASHAEFEATLFGYRVTIYAGRQVIGSSHFSVPAEYRIKGFSKGVEIAYREAKKYAAAFGVC